MTKSVPALKLKVGDVIHRVERLIINSRRMAFHPVEGNFVVVVCYDADNLHDRVIRLAFKDEETVTLETEE